MTLVYAQGGKRQQQEVAGDWELAAQVARQLIMYRGATGVVIHEEDGHGKSSGQPQEARGQRRAVRA